MRNTHHILVVDDQKLVLRLIERELAQSGIDHRATLATSGIEALRLVASDPPDLVILDVMMPRMNGIELCRHLKDSPAMGDVPVIMLTALDDSQSRVQAIEAGADDYITKPFNGQELLARVRSLLRLSETRRQLREERDRLNTIISSTSDAIVVNSREGHPVLLNPAAERLLSLQSSEVQDRTWDELLDDQALLSLFESALDSQRPYSIEVTTTEERVLYASITPLKDLGVVLVMHDVTESKELERVRWAAERAEKERLRQTLERYVGSELAERVLHQKRGLLEQRERVDAVVLFADLRGFTRVTGHLSPDTVVNILNAFFTEMGQLVHSNQGTIFDLIGDELMVGYGVPFPQDDAADRALQVAVAMQRRFAQLSEHWLDKHDVELGLGIGLNRGPVIVGNIGSPSLMHYTMVGDPVNFAHRLVEIAGPSEIILSESVLGGLLNPVKGLPVERLLPQTIKGKEGTHVLHRVKI